MKRIFSIIIVVLILSASFAGCGNGGQTAVTSTQAETKAEQTTIAQTTAAPAGPVSLRFSWWGGESRHEASLAAIKLYTDKNPNVKIEAEYSGWDGYYQKLVTQLASGAAPDIMQIDQPWIYELMQQGEMFADLYKLSNVISLEGYDKQFLKDICEIDGKLQGVPTGISAVTFIYNKEFFTKFGIDTQTDWNWDNLAEIGAKVHNQDKNAYLIQSTLDMVPPLLITYITQKTGESIVKDDYTLGFDKQTADEAFNYLKKLMDEGVLLPFEEAVTVKEADEHMKWAKGETGIILNWNSVIPKIKSNSKFELGVAHYPVLAGTKNTGISVLPSQLMAINNKSSNIEECGKFLYWLFNDKESVLALADSRGTPAVESARQTLVEANKIDTLVTSAIQLSMERKGLPPSALSNNSELIKIFTNVFEAVAFKKATPQQAADDLIKQFTQKLEELKSAKK